MIKRRKSIWDTFLFYDPLYDRLIIRARDYAIDGVWESWNSDGIASWYTKTKPPKFWVLIDRVPGNSL